MEGFGLGVNRARGAEGNDCSGKKEGPKPTSNGREE